MPFTFSHPVAILPFTKTKNLQLSFTALFIGSIAPDFEYFLRMKMYGDFSHTFIGAFVFDLPLVILLSFIYHYIVKISFINSLPNVLQARLAVYNSFNWANYFKQNFVVVILSALIGITTHIIWDGFTHSSGFMVDLIPKLRGSFSVFGVRLKVFNVLQHLSSVGGLAIMVYWLYKLPKDTTISTDTKYWFWALVVMFSFLFFGLRYYWANDISSIKHIIVPIMSAVMAAIVTASLLFEMKDYFSSKQSA